MPVGLGSNSYLIMGEQSAPQVKAPWGAFSDKFYEFTGGGISADTEYTNIPSNKGNFGPTASQAGQLSVGGSLQLAQDITHMGLVLKYVMYSAPLTSALALVPYTLFTSAAFTSTPTPVALTNSDFVADTQPKVYIPKQTSAYRSINCGKLVFDFGSAARAGDNANITIVGFEQHEDLKTTEVIEVANTGGAIPDQTSEFAFAEVTSVTFNGFTTNGTVEIKVDPGVYKHVFEVGNTMLNGLTVEMLKDPHPNVYQDVQVSEATFNLADANEIDLTVVGGKAFLRENAENGGTAPSDTTSMTRPGGITSPGWGTIFRLNDNRILVNGGSFTVNHSLGETNYSYGKLTYVPLQRPTANRVVTLTTEIGYPPEDVDGNEVDLTGFALGRDVSASFETNAMTYGALHNSFTLEIPTGRLTTFPDPPSLDQGEIALPITIEGYAKGTTTDFRLVVINQESPSEFLS